MILFFNIRLINFYLIILLITLHVYFISLILIDFDFGIGYK